MDSDQPNSPPVKQASNAAQRSIYEEDHRKVMLTSRPDLEFPGL